MRSDGPSSTLRALRARLNLDESGFGLIEAVMALGVILIALLALIYTASIGFTDVAFARQRQTATAIGDRIMEEVRGLPYTTIKRGMADVDPPNGTPLTNDPNVVSCAGVLYFQACPAVNPSAERIVHTSGLPATCALPCVQPLVPHEGTYGPPTYTSTYTWDVYVTQAVNVPTAGALRVTVVVAWSQAERHGVANSIQTQELIYQPQGSTDAGTNPDPGGSDPFFFSTGSVQRGSVTVSPNSAVGSGSDTGIQGFGSWDSITADLYGLDANVQQQQLTQASSQVTLAGARFSMSGAETATGAAAAAANADDDPATPSGTSSAPTALSQGASSLQLTGGGNAISAGAPANGAPSCPTNPLHPIFVYGAENGSLGTSTGGIWDTYTGSPSVDGTVKRTGNYSLKIPSSSSFVQENVNANLAVARFAFEVTGSLPSSNVTIAQFNPTSGGGSTAAVALNGTTHQLGAQIGGTFVWNSTVVSAGTWYEVEAKVNMSSSPRTMDMSVGGVANASTASATATPATVASFQLGGSYPNAAYYDDVLLSSTASDWPVGDGGIYALSPDGMSTHNNPTKFVNDDGTAIGASTYTRLNEIPQGSTSSYVVQQTQDTGSSGVSYVGVTFADTVATCVDAVAGEVGYNASASSSVDNGKTSIFSGSTESVVFSGNMATQTAETFKEQPVTPAAAPWTPGAVNSLIARIGYSTDNAPNPRWQALLLEVDVPVINNGGPAGPDTGSTVSETNASIAPCGTPTQADTRPCAFSREDYSQPAAVSQVNVDLTGSGGGQCLLSRVVMPSTSYTSYVYGRRVATSGIGEVKENVVRYYGTATFGQLCSGLGSVPSGWPGYYVQFTAGSSPSCATAEAGIQTAPPSTCSPGTISFYNGSGVTSFSPPANGTWPSQPAPLTAWRSGSWQFDVSASLASGQTSVSPAGAAGTADRAQERAVVGAPITGSITYKVTNTSTNQVVLDVTIRVDLGSLSAYARQA